MDLMALQSLAVTVNGLKESIHLTATRVSTISNENNQKASTYHSRFSELLNKYSTFANQYKFELDRLHKELLNDINFQTKQREQQEREFQEKLESLSNKSSHSNLEIADNVEESGYHSSTNSMNMNMNNMPSPQTNQDSEFEQSQNTVSMDIPIHAIPSQPQPMKSKKSEPYQQPKPKKNNNKNKNKTKNKTKKSKGKNNQNQKKAQNMNKARSPSPKTKAKATPEPPKEPMVIRTVTADIEKKENNDIIANYNNDKYVYNADNIECLKHLDFSNDNVYKHTTMIHISNIPSNIKIAAVQFFIMKKFKVTMRQIEETKLNSGLRSQYALVRFRSDVPLDHINKYMDMLNSENARIREEKKSAQDAMHSMSSKKKDNKDGEKKNKKKVKTSWQTRVFIKYQDPEYHYSFYESEEAMYNDYNARHTLFVRNFDVVKAENHKELTDEFLKYGDLVEDVDIKIDAFGDPYCIVIFKFLNDAIYCCNSDLYFGGRRLEMRYSKY